MKLFLAAIAAASIALAGCDADSTDGTVNDTVTTPADDGLLDTEANTGLDTDTGAGISTDTGMATGTTTMP